MKQRMISLTLAFVMLFCLSACAGEYSAQTKESPDGRYWVSSARTVIPSQNSDSTAFYRYDAEKGIVYASPDKKFSEDETAANTFETQDGRISKTVTEDGKGVTLYEYDEGRLVSKSYSYAFEKVTTTDGEEYNQYGIREKVFNVTTKEGVDTTTGTEFIFDYLTFDENGKPTQANVTVKLIGAGEGGEVKASWKWDENGNMLEEYMEGTVGGEYSVIKNVKEYDGFGNCVHTLLYLNDDLYQEEYFTYIPAA